MDRPKLMFLIIAPIIGVFVTVFLGECLSAHGADQVFRITAKRYEYMPKDITLKKGTPVVLELTSHDVMHGFNCSDLGIRSDLLPGKISTIRLTPQKVGVFPFHCDNFCGSGHETMTGTITVTE